MAKNNRQSSGDGVSEVKEPSKPQSYDRRMKAYKAIHDLTKIIGFRPPVDTLMAGAGEIVIDIIEFDAELSRRDSEYDNAKCLYQGKEASMNDYMVAKFGEESVKLLEDAI
jgi:hypothetical protein